MKNQENTIAKNKKANFEYFLEEEIEAGLVLNGWEIKSIREGRIQIADAHIIVKNGEAFLLGAQIQPLPTTCKQSNADATRTRKLLLHNKEIKRLIGSIERSGYTVIPTLVYWKKNKVKLKIALAKGKKTHDKRDSLKTKEWDRQRARLLKNAYTKD